MIIQILLKTINLVQIERNKIHDFGEYKRGFDFSVDFFDSYNSAKMITSVFVKPGERVILKDRELTFTYRVSGVEHYSNSSFFQEVSLEIDRESELNL